MQEILLRIKILTKWNLKMEMCQNKFFKMSHVKIINIFRITMKMQKFIKIISEMRTHLVIVIKKKQVNFRFLKNTNKCKYKTRTYLAMKET
jgi:hypothetical protein